jgi:hypothetical protein
LLFLAMTVRKEKKKKAGRRRGLAERYEMDPLKRGRMRQPHKMRPSSSCFLAMDIGLLPKGCCEGPGNIRSKQRTHLLHLDLGLDIVDGVEDIFV